MAKTKNQSTQAAGSVSSDEQIGFHKGALSTLAKEREEMMKILQIVEQLMQMHIKGLKDLGVDLEAAAREAQKAGKPAKKAEKKPIEDILR
ncbi:MAG: hypothetical protein ABIJ08_04675 [Nanoarchaeota archaeon]